MRIIVEQRHLDEGKKVSADRCPLALAINDSLLDGYHAHVGVRTYSVYTGHYCVELRTICDGECIEARHSTPEMSAFVAAYDRGVKLLPQILHVDLGEGVTAQEA